MCKKFLSLLLAVMLIVSVMSVGFVSASAATTDGFTPDPGKLYFDTDGTGWEMGTKNKVAFHIFGGDLEKTLAWGASKEIGTATEGESGVYEFDPTKNGQTFNPGVQYKIIFVRTEGKNWTNQTYDLLFTTDCFGHVAYCDGTEYENPVDSSKKTLAAFWKEMDATVVGPVKQISSIGNVVGTCLAEGTTDESLFNEFLTVVDDTTGTTKYQNAYHFVVEAGQKTEQQMIDDIGAGLSLTKQQVYDAFAASDVESTWDYNQSSLPGEVHFHTPGEPVQENVVPATYKTGGSYESVVYCSDPDCGKELSRETVNTDPVELDPTKLYFDTDGTGWEMGSKNKVAFHIFGGDLEKTLAWGSSKEIGAAAAGLAGVFEFDPTKNGQTFNPGVQYKVIFVRTDGKNWTNQTYDLLFTVDCFGHAAFCDGTEYENPVDSSKKTLAAFWYGMDATVVGPVKQISSIGNVVGTCLAEGTTDESLFNEFLTVVDDTTGTTKYQNAYHFVVEAGQKTEQQMIDDIGTGLSLTKQQVYDAFAASGVESTWDYTQSSLPGEVTPPHTHTPGEVQIENDTPSTCKVAGTYDEVVYCTGCGEELSRETKYHELAAHTPGEVKIENDTPSTCKVAGTYDEVVYCTVCGDELSRETKYHELAAHTPGEPVRENEVPATCTAAGSYDEVVKCSVCGDEISRTPKIIEKKAHTLTFVPEVPASESRTGIKAHYVCSECKGLFLDEAGSQPTTEAALIIPQLAHVHAPAEPVIENVVPATCQHAGSQDKVVYCSTCGAELSRETIVIGKLLHTSGEPVYENVVPATCQQAGSQDKVTYCTACGEELSREHQIIEKTAHTMKRVNSKKATCTEDGYKSYFVCTECGEYYSWNSNGEPEVTWDQIVIPAHHTLTFVEEVHATIETEGVKAHYVCSVCGKFFLDEAGTQEVTAAELVIPKLPEYILGDVDGNGEVDIVDVTFIQRVLANMKPETYDIKRRGDVDKNDALEIIDATILQRWLLGLEQNRGIGA